MCSVLERDPEISKRWAGPEPTIVETEKVSVFQKTIFPVYFLRIKCFQNRRRKEGPRPSRLLSKILPSRHKTDISRSLTVKVYSADTFVRSIHHFMQMQIFELNSTKYLYLALLASQNERKRCISIHKLGCK